MDLNREFNRSIKCGSTQRLLSQNEVDRIQSRLGQETPVGLTADLPPTQWEAIQELCIQLSFCLLALEHFNIIKDGKLNQEVLREHQSKG